MRSVRKFIAAAVAAAAIATVSATAAFASTDAIKPGDGVNYIKPGTYFNLGYGIGYSTVINTSSTSRYCTAYVETQDEYGTPISGGSATKSGNTDTNMSLTAEVAPAYKSTSYQYYCVGNIRGGTAAITPIIERQALTYTP